MAQYVCTECGKKFPKLKGVCTCGEVASIVEDESQDITKPTAGTKTAAKLPSTAATKLSKTNGSIARVKTGINEMDRVLGGGLVDSEVLLLAGQPGAGKSTLCLHIANNFATEGSTVLYASGEESIEQIKIRANRLGIENDNLYLLHTTSLEEILGNINEIHPSIFIVDSLQTIASSELTGSLGSIQQSKESAHVLHGTAKALKSKAVLVNQVNKDGDFSGANSIQHVVDASLFFESHRETPLRFLRAEKNRFGTTDEVGVFQHGDNGLEEVPDPSGLMMDEDENDSAGAAIGFTSEGVRQIPIEVQALVSRSSLPNPRKQFNGIHPNRGQIICAILDKFADVESYENDIFSSTVFGIKVDDPQCDLAIAAAILSSKLEAPIDHKTAFVGEMNLTGRLRGSSRINSIIKEAERLGVEKIILPESSIKIVDRRTSIKIVGVTNVKGLRKIIRSH